MLALMVVIFVYLLFRGPATPWGDVSQGLIYYQVCTGTYVCVFVVYLDVLYVQATTLFFLHYVYLYTYTNNFIIINQPYFTDL